MATFDILIGTTSGNTEYLALELADYLKQKGHHCEIHDEPDFDSLAEQAGTHSTWIACVASHGAGDYADSMLEFGEQLAAFEGHLNQQPYLVIAIGDSCYDTYCAAGRDCDERLEKAGAKRLAERLEIDMSQDDPEEKLFTWLENIQL
ncbi:flavodoxin domain-containing protein [Pseudidiomarina taiwanensis]|uniref:Flavodoxin n=1 Tax=Pseudidiomarina taiwanensis TaxID=337250 RepID=A0A432ZEL5_9GAMM|nr:flavodoxin domain-containing protein [Pseudidiomarina taiwanensis]RUO76425.1 flavodoxin [Pseudidiomarina taiwanensis]